MAGAKDVVFGVLVLLFPKTWVEPSGSQNEVAVQLPAQAPAIISQVFVFKNTQYF